MINHGKILEDKLAKALDDLNIPYTREGSKRSYGTRHSNKGKFDFMIDGKLAVECKSINKSTDLRMPWPNQKSPMIKSHQLKALRAEAEKGNIAGLLIEVREVEETYFMPIRELDAIVREYGMIRTLNLSLLRSSYAQRVYDVESFVRGIICSS